MQRVGSGEPPPFCLAHAAHSGARNMHHRRGPFAVLVVLGVFCMAGWYKLFDLYLYEIRDKIEHNFSARKEQRAGVAWITSDIETKMNETATP